MILYEGGEDIPTKINTSNVYYKGSTHPTNNFGIITVLAQEDRYYLATSRGNKYKSYCYVIGMFEDGTKIQVATNHIKNGSVKNPNHPNVYNRGFQGQGEYSCETHRTLYLLWEGMFRRCYSKSSLQQRPTYKDCEVDERWWNFQTFCKDIKQLEGYPKWFYAQAQKINNYQLDKDIKIKGNKIYSKETCLFVSHKENMGRYNKKQPLTGLTYIGTRLNDGHTEEFNNQAEFADKYALHKSTVCQCCLGRSKTTGGWKIIVKEEK